MINKKLNNKIVCIVGTTASGKTTIGVDLAHRFNGEIISADSRQVYRDMDIGTGKDLKDYHLKISGKTYDAPYHLIDIISPNTEFNLAKFQKKSNNAIKDILKRNKLPIIVGGTGLYVQALVDGFELSHNESNMKHRKELEEMDLNEIVDKVKKANSAFLKNLNNSERNNKRRLIRYLEQLKNKNNPLGKKREVSKYDFLVLAITWPREVLKKRIYTRLLEWFEKEDIIGEVRRLHSKKHISWKRLESFGLAYKFIARYLKKEISYSEMVESTNISIRQFAKRQMTWLRRWEKQGGNIVWVKDGKTAEKYVRGFIKQ